MEAVRYQEDYFEPLFSYWKKLSERIPYFFSVSPQRWCECLLEDKLGSERIFRFQEIFLAIDKGEVVGFVQYGQPAFAWDENGQLYNNPRIGVIRHLYFEEGRLEAARLLFACSENYMKQFSGQHAFYHIFGMSCNAHHGKLHQSLEHVDRFLCANGYQVEHENVYYTLELEAGDPFGRHGLQLAPKPVMEPGVQNYEICLQNQIIGTIQIRFLDQLTGGATTDIACLTWFGLKKEFQGQGWGTQAMQLLVQDLSKNYRQLHLDTASTNRSAQQFYERFGFQNQGRTRCYLRSSSESSLEG
jgi:ribosomal protein S18 acetylase RimI-like enzyme